MDFLLMNCPNCGQPPGKCDHYKPTR
jgi:hypothetical protein